MFEVHERVTGRAVSGTVAVSAGVVAMVAPMERPFFIALTVAAVASVYFVLCLVLGRLSLLSTVYVMGYRHGRRDANMQLFEDGLWLANAAEKRANEELGDD